MGALTRISFPVLIVVGVMFRGLALNGVETVQAWPQGPTHGNLYGPPVFARQRND
jgi:hypothetical protein